VARAGRARRVATAARWQAELAPHLTPGLSTDECTARTAQSYASTARTAQSYASTARTAQSYASAARSASGSVSGVRHVMRSQT